MRFLLDTNVVSELRKVLDGNADSNVGAWAGALDAGVGGDDSGVGARRVVGRTEGDGSAPVDGSEGSSRVCGRIVPVGERVALRCAALHVPELRPLADSLIAATALVHGMTIATRNVRHFAAMAVPLVNPWDDTNPPAALSR